MPEFVQDVAGSIIPEGSIVGWVDPSGHSCREWAFSYFQFGDTWSSARRPMPKDYLWLGSRDKGPYFTKYVHRTEAENMVFLRLRVEYVDPWSIEPMAVQTHPSVVPRIADVLIAAGVKGADSRPAARALAREGALAIQWQRNLEWEKIYDSDQTIKTREFLVRRERSVRTQIIHLQVTGYKR